MKVDFIDQAHFDNYIDNLIERALNEDVGEGDHTSLSTIPNNTVFEAKLLVKDEGIIAGIDLAFKVFTAIDKEIVFEKYFEDGDAVKVGDIAFTIKAKAHTILTGERLALNFMQRLSGIATKTYELSKRIAPYNTKLLDTRKTTPGLRLLEKWAVKTGGGINHRIGLYDMILVKDNHVDAAGSVTKAINLVHQYLQAKNLNIPIEVEIRTFDELNEILEIKGVDRILLDNFTPENLIKAVKMVDGKLITEASGGINDKNIVDYARSGVNYISSGALTHTIIPLDLSLKLTK